MPQWLSFSDILNVSITASWLVLAVLILRLLLKKAPKWTHVALWGLVAVRLLLPFSIKSIFSLIPSTQTVPSDILTYEGEQLSQPGRLDIVTNPVFSEDISIALPQTVDRVQQQTVDFTVIWLAGAAIMGLYAVLSYWRLHRKVRTAVLLEKGIYQSAAVPSPFVLGIIRPNIFLPFTMTQQDIPHVIAHERAHIRRKDHWWKPLGFFLLTIHWFNPVIWLAYILLCRDIELACDEKVIKELGTEQRADYSQALLNCSVRRHTIAACPLAFGEVSVKERVKSVLNYKKPAFWLIIVAVIACIAVAVCFLTDPPEKESARDRLAVGDYVCIQHMRVNSLCSYYPADPAENFAFTVNEDRFVIENLSTATETTFTAVNWGWQAEEEAGDRAAFLQMEAFCDLNLGKDLLYQWIDSKTHIVKSRGMLYVIGEGFSENGWERIWDIYQIAPENCPNPGILLSGTKQLTLYDLTDLAGKGNALNWRDLIPYQCTDVGSGICIFRYQIDSFFYLDLSLVPTDGAYPETATEHFVLHHINGNFVDIRTGDVEIFIRDQERVDYLYYWIKNDTMSFPVGSARPQQGTILHGSSSTGLFERFHSIEDSEPPLPEQNMICLRFVDEVPLKITWKTFDPFNTSTSGSIDDPSSISTMMLGANMGLPLASNLENIPPRRVQILCQYQNRTVEYLLIIAST